MQVEPPNLLEQDANGFSKIQSASPKIRGFLVVIAIGLIISLLKNLESFGWWLVPFRNQQIWERLTTGGSAAYHPYWRPVLLFELVSSSAIVAINLIAILFFFRKHRFFPKIVVIGVPVIFILILFGYYLDGLVPAIAASADYGKQKHALIVRFIALHIWIPYFIVSDRVKKTFVR